MHTHYCAKVVGILAFTTKSG